MERVSELVKQQLGEIIQQLTLTGCGFITVTSAEVAPDLKDAQVYISVIGNAEQQKRSLQALTQQHSRIQAELAHRIVLKFTPRLHFALDETESHAQKIERLLSEINPGTTHE